jgi:hypothetical protein
MSNWTPATADEVRQEIEAERLQSEPSIWATRSSFLVDLYSCAIERFGNVEEAFVVARCGNRVVFFDDVEEIFGTADEVSGRLENCASYGPLFLALGEAIREAS